MKAVNDYRILMPNIPYYKTGVAFNEFAVVYYTGINLGNYSYTGPNGDFSISENITEPFSTGYYYAKRGLNSGDNRFYQRPDATSTGPSPNPWTQDFFFVPCYGSTVTFSANYYENEYQDKYKTILGKSENTVFVSANLEFKNISDDELKALNHFYQRYYTEPSQENGQGKTTVSLSLFPPHTLSRPFYLKGIRTDYQNINANNVTLSVESPFVCSTEWKGKLIPFTAQQEFYDGKVYGEHDYVFLRNAGNANGYYYFSGKSSAATSPLNATGGWTQKFYFVPDLVSEIGFDSKVFKNDLGNFYLNQDVGLNPNFFDFSLTFSNRSDKEAKALLHFLENHNGIDVFKYDGHTFFTGTRFFYCPEWNHTYNFYDNNTISARFIELKGLSDKVSEFNSTIISNGVDFGFLPAGFETTKSVYITNNDRKYPITYVAYDKIEESAYLSDFFNLASSRELKVKAGGSGFYDIKFWIPQNVDSSTPTSPRGYFPISQENEIVGTEGQSLRIHYTGARVNIGGAAPNNFLSGVQNCIASPSYQDNVLGFVVRWTVPPSGYYFTGFNARISLNSGFSPSTGLNVEVPLNSSTYLYEIGEPGQKTFQTFITGINADTPYYISVSGINDSYTNHVGQYVFASGVNDALTWPNPTTSYSGVQSGLTTGTLSLMGLTPPSITASKIVKTKNLSNVDYEYFDLYNYLVTDLSFSNAKNNYSGIVLNFSNVKIGPRSPLSDYDIYDTGSFIVTGDFSSLVTGVTLNLTNNSYIYGKGGSSSRLSSDKAGKDALYINCSGILNINLDDTSKIAGGGGAGENVFFLDIAEITDGKFAVLKQSFNNNSYAGSGVKDLIKNIQYNSADLSKIYQTYNDNNVKINSSSTSSLGSSIFYDFFNTSSSVDQDFIIGGAGAMNGAGSGSAVFASTENADLQQGSLGYQLVNLLIPGRTLYEE